MKPPTTAKRFQRRFPAIHAYGPETHGLSKQRTLCQSFMALESSMATSAAGVTCGQCLKRMGAE